MEQQGKPHHGAIPSLRRTISGGSTIGSIGNGMGNRQIQGQTPPTLNGARTPPPMMRAVTASGPVNRMSMPNRRSDSQIGKTSPPPPNDWRTFLTIEERLAVRSKIRDAYTNQCRTYEELLQAAVSIEEELIHASAPSRLDYFKGGFEFENRVKLKRNQLQGQLAALEAANNQRSPVNSGTNSGGLKRSLGTIGEANNASAGSSGIMGAAQQSGDVSNALPMSIPVMNVADQFKKQRK